MHAVGHSLGAHAALRAEARVPGTFASIYAFEPIFVLGPEDVVPLGVFSRTWRAPLAPPRAFASRAAAAAAFASKPPMRGFHRGALEAYVEHGFVDFVQDASVHPATSSASLSSFRGVRLAMRRDDEALVFALGARETEALKSVCAPGAVSCPVTIARGSTQASHDPTLTPYPAFVAGVLAERMGRSASRAWRRVRVDHFRPWRTRGLPSCLEPRADAAAIVIAGGRIEKPYRTYARRERKENETIATNDRVSRYDARSRCNVTRVLFARSR